MPDDVYKLIINVLSEIITYALIRIIENFIDETK